jgi:TolA-binding protein
MKLTAAALAALMLSAAARAEDAKPAPAPAAAAPATLPSAPAVRDSVMTFLRNLKLALTQSAVSDQRNRASSTAAVAAVRGKDQSSDIANPDEPSIKGDAAAAKSQKMRAENAEFEKAVDLLLSGKTDDGVKALEAFKAAHPKSRNLPSVQQAIDKAKSLSADKPADVAPAPAAPAKS